MYVMLSLIASAGGSASGGAQPSPFGMFLPLILIFLIMWLMIFQPQAKKQKQHQKMLAETQPGDRVLTIGGILGTVKGFKKDNQIVILEIADNCKIELLRSSIAQNFSAEERNLASAKK